MKNTKNRNALLLLSIAMFGCGAADHEPLHAAPIVKQVIWLKVGKPVTYQSTKIYRFEALEKRNYRVALSRTGTANLRAVSTGDTGTTTICAQRTRVDVSVVGPGSGQITLSVPSEC